MNTLEDWNIEELTGYKPISTFYTDFSIAEKYGLEGIEDTYKRVMKAWKDDYKYLTELVMVLNWKCWAWYDKKDGNPKNNIYSIQYQELYEKARKYAETHLKGEELSYYFETTD